LNTGILRVTHSTITQNGLTDIGQSGGGILNTGTLRVTHSTIAENSAFFGAGIANGLLNVPGGNVTLMHSTIAHNHAEGGAGIDNGQGVVVVTDSALTDNTAAPSDGGAIRNTGTLVITNTTFARNQKEGAGGSGGAVRGGGAISTSGTLILTNSTLATNSVTSSVLPTGGGGIASSGLTLLQNTILAQNSAGREGPDCLGAFISLGNTLIGDPTGCTITLHPSDLTGDPGLDAFTDDGTPGNGHFPLLPTRQAIDAGSNAVWPRRDQIGQRRIGPCDIGAIEFHPHGEDPVEDPSAQEDEVS
jgi:hypothetical protein